MNSDELIEFEGRQYVNPDISRDEQTAFVDTLRDLQAQNNAQIATETHNLGTDVEPHLGGLSGSEEYWQSKYQTPQVNAMVADMKAVAQQSALNTALQNYQDSLQERYNQAYKNYQKRAYNYSLGGNGSVGGGSKKLAYDVNPQDEGTGDTNENKNTSPGNITSVQGGLNVYTDYNGGKWTLRNLESGDETLLGGLTSIGGNLLRTFPDGTPLTNGSTYGAGGKMFMYIQNSQYPNGTFFRVGDSPTMSYR